MKFTIRGRRKNELSILLEQIEYSFNFPRTFFIPELTYHPELKPEYTRMGFLDNVLVSSLQIIPKTIYAGGTHLRLGGIANVGTLPAFRHRSFNDQLMRDAVQFMKQDGMVISGLYTGVHDVYRPHGYETWTQKDLFVKELPSFGKAINSPKYSFEAYQNKDLPQVQRIYHDFSATLNGPVVRNTEYWQAQFKWATYYPSFFYLVKDKQNKVLAYLRGTYDKSFSNAYIREACGPRDNHEIWKYLIQNLWREFSKIGINKTVRWSGCSKNHPLVSAMLSLGFTLDSKINRGFMINILNLAELLKQYAPILQRRLSQFLPWNGTVKISSPLDSATLEITPGIIKVSQIPSLKETKLSHIELAEWLLGRKRLKKIAASSEENIFLNMTVSDIEFFDQLIPEKTWTHWYTDSY